MSNLVEKLRKRGSSPNLEASGSQPPMRSPYPTAPSTPWVPGSSLANKRKSKDMGPKKSPYPTKPSAASTSSLPKVEEPLPQRIFSSPEPPFQIPEMIVIAADEKTTESPTIDSASYTESSAESAGPVTPVNTHARRPLSYSSKPLPSTPERVYLRAPSYAPPRRYTSSPGPSILSMHADVSGTSHFSHDTTETRSLAASTRNGSCDPLIRTVTPPDITGQLSTAQPQQLKYDVPPPAYQTLETLDDDLDFPSPPPTDEKGFATFQGIPIHQYAYLSLAPDITSFILLQALFRTKANCEFNFLLTQSRASHAVISRYELARTTHLFYYH